MGIFPSKNHPRRLDSGEQNPGGSTASATLDVLRLSLGLGQIKHRKASQTFQFLFDQRWVFFSSWNCACEPKNLLFTRHLLHGLIGALSWWQNGRLRNTQLGERNRNKQESSSL
ncbi:unnamed protein product [Eretmochelys imbricata]